MQIYFKLSSTFKDSKVNIKKFHKMSRKYLTNVAQYFKNTFLGGTNLFIWRGL